MTQVASDWRTFQHGYFVPIIISIELPVCCGAGKHRTIQIRAMAGLAGAFITLIKILMLQVPGAAVDVMHAVGAAQGQWQTGMTDTTLNDGAAVSLQIFGRLIVIRIRIGDRPDCMGGAVAGLAGDIAVTQAVAVEGIVTLLQIACCWQ